MFAIERLHHPVPKLGVSTNLSSLREMTPALDRISIFQVHVVGHNRASTLKETGVDQFNAIKRNLDQLFATRKPSQQITMKILVRDDNYADLPMFLDFIAGYPCDSVVVKLCQDFLRNTAVLRPDSIESIRSLALSHAINEKFDFTLDGLDDELHRPGSPPPSTCSFAESGLYRLVTASGLVFPCVASTYSEHNACDQLTGERSQPLTPNPAGGHPGSTIDPNACPLRACRHYRGSLMIDHLRQSPESLLDEPCAGVHPDPVLL